jgi:hypothetical protein
MGRAVSFQITVLKVLAGQPEGRAFVADLTPAVSILMSSGPDWFHRTKGLAARAPHLDIFGSAFVLRDDSGWQITEMGRQFLDSLETVSAVANDQEQACEISVEVVPIPLTQVQPVIRLVLTTRQQSSLAVGSIGRGELRKQSKARNLTNARPRPMRTASGAARSVSRHCEQLLRAM